MLLDIVWLTSHWKVTDFLINVGRHLHIVMVLVGMFQQDGGIEEMIEMRNSSCNNVDDYKSHVDN